ncbi:MAG: DUF6044 family protein [Rhodospirillales bacterium]|jgi:hypothetical protein|nr:DUF6044 family protein [Rhodospirillales bacterium]
MARKFFPLSKIEWLLLAGAAWLSFDVFILGQFGYVGSGEYGEVFVPALIANKVWGFGAPYWNIFSTSGFDRLALGGFGWLNALTFAALPGWLAIYVLTGVKLAAAVVGTYALSRRSLGLSRLAAVFAALLFGYSHTTPSVTHAVIAYLPLTILAMTGVFEDGRDWKRWLGLFAVGLALATTNHLPFIMPFPFLIISIWFAVVDPRRSPREWILVVGFAAFVVLLRLPDYIAVGAYGDLSARHVLDLTEAASPATLLGRIGQQLANLFIGRPPLVLASLLMVCGLVFYRWWVRGLRRLMLALLAGWVLTMVLVAVKIVAVDIFPVLRTFSLGRFFRYLEMFLPMAAAFGFMALEENTAAAGASPTMMGRARRAAPVLAFAALFVLALEHKYQRVRDWVGQGGYTLLFQSPVLRQLADDIHRSGVPTRVASFQMYPNYPNAYGIETAGGYQALTLLRYWQFWTTVMAPGADKFPSATGVLDLGRVMLSPHEHRTEWDLAELYNANLLSLVNVGYMLSRDRLVAPSLKLLRGPETPWSALDVGQKVRSNMAGNFTGRTHLYVYENRDVLPRFFLADRLRVLDSGAAVLDALSTAGLDELRRTAFVERAVLPPSLAEDASLSSGTARLSLYEADRIRFSLDTSGPSVLIVTNSYSPYWRAFVDGVETPLFPADHAFWGIYLAPGAKSVELLYDPPYRLF